MGLVVGFPHVDIVTAFVNISFAENGNIFLILISLIKWCS